MNIESIVGLGLVAVGIAIALWGASRPNRIELNGESLTIKGNYSHTIAIDDIESVVLADKLPEIVLRTNGIGFRHIKVGHFRLKGTGKCRLYVNLRYPPYVHIVTVPLVPSEAVLSFAPLANNCDERISITANKTKKIFRLILYPPFVL